MDLDNKAVERSNLALPISVAAFTGGRNVPSARFRVREYIEWLNAYGISVTEFSAPLGTYPPQNRLIRPLWAAATLATRLPGVLMSHRYDLTLLQREILSTFATLESLTKRPRVMDVDDAIWLHRDGRFAEKLARNCEAVICGNSFLAEKFSQWNQNVTIIPTAIDTNRFIPESSSEELIIGWSGTSGGFKYLYEIEAALYSVLQKMPRVKLRIVSNALPAFTKITTDRIEFIRWSPENEVQAIQGMTVGIMPLKDSLWERGKCSFKMLTYMACGVPVVVSPVGMNVEVLAQGNIGLGAQTDEEWVSALVFLLEDEVQRKKMGENGRQVVLNNYSIRILAPKLANTLVGVINKGADPDN